MILSVIFSGVSYIVGSARKGCNCVFHNFSGKTKNILIFLQSESKGCKLDGRCKMSLKNIGKFKFAKNLIFKRVI